VVAVVQVEQVQLLVEMQQIMGQVVAVAVKVVLVEMVMQEWLLSHIINNKTNNIL